MDVGEVESVLGTTAGFFSQFFFLINHAIYAKTNMLKFRIKSTNWLFKYKDGWTDYFENYELVNSNTNGAIIYKKHCDILIDAPILKYKEMIFDIYKYNTETNAFINSHTQTLNLGNNYDSVFIRRGDKLTSGESNYINAGIYIDLLLIKKPAAKVVFIQTDDFTVIEEIKEHLTNLQITLDIITLCNEYERGAFVYEYYKDTGRVKPRCEKTADYIRNKDIKTVKSISAMDKNQLKTHTLTMITGIDIVCKSNICILDYQSNVGRFIKLFHKDPSSVFNVLDPENDINYNKIRCPSFSF